MTFQADGKYLVPRAGRPRKISQYCGSMGKPIWMFSLERTYCENIQLLLLTDRGRVIHHQTMAAFRVESSIRPPAVFLNEGETITHVELIEI